MARINLRIGGKKTASRKTRPLSPAQIPLPILKHGSNTLKGPQNVTFAMAPKKSTKSQRGPMRGKTPEKYGAKTVRFCPMRGRVFSRTESLRGFVAQGEVLAEMPGQLPQFLPRLEWPEDPDAGAEHRPDETYLDSDWVRDDTNIPQAQLAARDVVDQGYPQLRPMPPYQARTSGGSGKPIYKDSVWQDHVGILHGIRNKTLSSESRGDNWFDRDQIMEMLMCVTYGMDANVAVLEPFVIAPPQNQPDGSQIPFSRKYYPEFDKKMTLGYIDYATLDQNRNWAAWQFKMREKMLSRRFLVAPINQFDSHWTITVFDRENGHLFIFDSLDNKRDKRTAATLDLWARFWQKLDMPYHFQYFRAPITEQPEQWECGLLCVYWVSRLLRERVGGDRDKIWDTNQTRILQADREVVPGATDNNYLIEKSSLPMPDWKPYGDRQNRLHALQFITRWAWVIIANELGLKNDQEMLRFDGGQKRSPISRVMNFIKELKLEDKKKDGKDKGKGKGKDTGNNQQTHKGKKVSNFFTGHGGMQFVFAPTIPPLPYDKNAVRAHHPTNDDLSGYVEFDPLALAPEPTQDIKKIKFPLPLRPITSFKIKSFLQLVTTATSAMQDYPLKLSVADLANPDRNMPDMMFNLSNVAIQQAVGGPPLLAFNATVHFDGHMAGQSVTTSIALPMPQGQAQAQAFTQGGPSDSVPDQATRTPLPDSLPVHRGKRSRDDDDDGDSHSDSPSNKRPRRSPSSSSDSSLSSVPESWDSDEMDISGLS